MRVAVVAGMLIAQSAEAEERFRLGVEVATGVANQDGETLAILAEVPAGGVGVRLRIDHGTVQETGVNYGGPLSGPGPTTLSRIAVGVESRSNLSKRGGVAAFGGAGLGLARVDGDIKDDITYRGFVLLQAGVELRWSRARLRPGFGLCIIAPELPALGLGLLTAALGADVAF